MLFVRSLATPRARQPDGVIGQTWKMTGSAQAARSEVERRHPTGQCPAARARGRRLSSNLAPGKVAHHGRTTSRIPRRLAVGPQVSLVSIDFAGTILGETDDAAVDVQGATVRPQLPLVGAGVGDKNLSRRLLEGGAPVGDHQLACKLRIGATP